MIQRLETPPPSPTATPLVTGLFDEKRGYANWRTHGTDDWLLICTLDGLGRFGFDTGQIITQPGDMILLRPRTLHDYGVEATVERWKLLWSHFQPQAEWLEWLDWPEVAPGLMRLTLGEPVIRQKVTARFLEAHRFATGALRQRELFAMNALEEVLLWCGTQNPRTDQARMDERIRDILEYLCSHLADKISTETLTKRSGLSVSRLAHLFQSQVGMTATQFLEMQRLNRAKQLLAYTPRSISAIAEDVGYDNPFYFTLRFKRFTGMSPSDFRRRAIEKQEL